VRRGEVETLRSLHLQASKSGRGEDVGEDERLNPNGGAIALGHPLGASGARILTTLLHEMQRRDDVDYGLATMCIGVGQGVAMVVEKPA